MSECKNCERLHDENRRLRESLDVLSKSMPVPHPQGVPSGDHLGSAKRMFYERIGGQLNVEKPSDTHAMSRHSNIEDQLDALRQDLRVLERLVITHDNQIRERENPKGEPPKYKEAEKPTIGRIVWYNLGDSRARTLHYPAIVTEVQEETVTLTVFGPSTFTVPRVSAGTLLGQWMWPLRA